MESAWNTYRNFLDNAPPHQVTQDLRNLFVPDDLINELIRRHDIESTKFVSLKEPLSVGRENAVKWYAGPRSDDKNWPAYRSHLQKSLDNDAIKKINDASDKVVAMLDHPATAKFNSRGLVVGHVQSGKTSNFTAVIAKAADRGYRMFIVLSGVHNALRRQTQARLIRDIVNLNPPLWHQITKLEHDFMPLPNPAALLTAKDQHLLLVVKKNAVVLRKLKKWLRSAQAHLHNCPALLIDDEADQATIATQSINPLINGVINSLPRVCYVGYTATPFANLLADPVKDDSFYPRDFILSLPRSEDYQGPEKLFGRAALDGEDPATAPGGLDMIRNIPDDEVVELRPASRGDAASFEPAITPSLRRAVLWFWLATAARRVRSGKTDHSSMLIHAHSDTRVHDSYGPPLHRFRREVLADLAEPDSRFLAEMRDLWAAESERVRAVEMGEKPLVIDDVLDVVLDVVDATKIIMDHYRSTDRLDYESEPKPVIAVGGNTLSRGLTLEGLVVSVFVRSSDVYDTLLQMGRWFGYRPGYTDLPRIYMPAEMRRWFAHLATVEAEMRIEIDRLLEEHKTPMELAVRIRCHPKMRVTAPSKEKAAVRAAAAYGGALVESRYFPTVPAETAKSWLDENSKAVQALLSASVEHGRYVRVDDGKSLWREVPTEEIVAFVDTYRFHAMSTDAPGKLMSAYIRKRRDNGGLYSWNVAVVGNRPRDVGKTVNLPDGRKVGLVMRTRTAASRGDDIADIRTLTGPRDEGLDLALDPNESVNRTKLKRERSKQQPERGLVLLYPIDAKSTPAPVQQRTAEGVSKPARQQDRAPLAAPGEVVWGVALVFPDPSKGQDVLVEYDYVAADLSKVFPTATDEEPEDVSVFEQDLDSVEAEPAP
ncbi:Z1 domain-containing protein [Paractinoplanes brasiliensis]|nr:Z1 domain-containing protein [Actinoplanes brasiliensis]GID28931.1 endonuclease [Actinoplanes brasiliensis]